VKSNCKCNRQVTTWPAASACVDMGLGLVCIVDSRFAGLSFIFNVLKS
jgi:hypothetical protein